MSANTGTAPAWRSTFAVETQVMGVVITSSPGFTPQASTARWSAAVPVLAPSAWRTPSRVASNCSNRPARGPVASQPERRQASTSAISASVIDGRA